MKTIIDNPAIYNLFLSSPVINKCFRYSDENGNTYTEMLENTVIVLNEIIEDTRRKQLKDNCKCPGCLISSSGNGYQPCHNQPDLDKPPGAE